MLPNRLYTAEGVRKLDRTAIEEFGIPGLTLMKRAGEAAFFALRRRWPDARAIAVVCGSGNNGGDGFVVARLAHEAGIRVRVAELGDPRRLSPDAMQVREEMTGLGIRPETFSPDLLREADVLIDAIFGTGLGRPVTGEWATALGAINAAPAPALAIDIPSGLHADTGAVLGSAVRASLTVTFIGLKRGLFTGQGRDYIGELVFAGLDVPEAVYARGQSAAWRVDHAVLAEALRPRAPTSHKGTHGHVLVVGGEVGFAGAARLAAEAAARSGAGLVSVATRAAHAATLTMMRPELMARGVEGRTALNDLATRADAVAVGPGLGTGPWGKELLGAAFELGRPLVVDADGLNLLAAGPVAPTPGARGAPCVLTPHPAEAGRLLRIGTPAVQADRFAAARAISEQYRCVCVLKGSGTVIHGLEGAVYVCSDGNPGLATGGTGDVLTGIIAAMLAQGFSAEEAAVLGVCAHAAAGDLAARDGQRGMLAGDVVEQLRAVVNPGSPA